MARSKMDEAKQLIQAKRYAEAKTLLKTIDHPIAADWVAKIDALEVPPVPQKPKPSHFVRNVFVSFMLFVCVAIVLLPRTDKPASSPPQPTVAPSTAVVGFNPTTEIPRPTIRPTQTAKPSPVPTVDKLQIIKDAVGQVMNTDVFANADAQAITVKFDLSDLSAHFAMFDVSYKFPQIVCALRKTGIKTKQYVLIGSIKVVDPFGKESKSNGATVTVSSSTAAKFNCDNTDGINIATAADTYAISPLIEGQ